MKNTFSILAILLIHPYEWWHFDYRGWEKYAIENVRFEEIE